MAITQDDVTRVARLARIALSESDSQTMQTELNGILGLIEQLQAVDTSGIEPMAHPLSAHRRRCDPFLVGARSGLEAGCHSRHDQ